MTRDPRPPTSNPGLEADLQRELSREPAEVDPFVEEPLVDPDPTRCGVILHLETCSKPISDRPSEPTEHETTDVPPSRRELVSKHVKGVEVDKLSHLAIPPVVEADTDAEVRLHRCLSAKRQHAHRGCQRHNTETKVLKDLRTVVVDEIGIHTWHGLLIEADTEAGIKVLSGTDQPLGPGRSVIEVANIERE